MSLPRHGNDRQRIIKPDLFDFYGQPLPWHWENELATLLTEKIGPGVDWAVTPIAGGGYEARARYCYAPYKFQDWRDAFEWVAQQFGLSRSKVD